MSTALSYNSGVETLTRRQSELAEVQDRLTSGKRVSKASDDPAAAARAERALAGIQRSETSQRAVDASRVSMTQTESAMADAVALMQEAREGLVAAGNGTYSDSERKGLSDKLRAIRNQLFDVANRSDGAGSYLFGGQGATVAPFVDAPGGVVYRSTPGQLLTEEDTALPLSNDGQATWMSARTGNGVFETRAGAMVANAWIANGSVSDPSAVTGSSYTVQFSVAAGATTYAILKDGAATAVTAAPYVSGQDITVDGLTFNVSGTPAQGDTFDVLPSTPGLSVFQALDKAVTDLGSGLHTKAQLAQNSGDNLRNFDAVMGVMSAARSTVGTELKRIDSETDRLDSMKLGNQTVRSDAEDLDMVAAYSDFQTRQSGYDAALKSYSMVQRLSLFQYLNG